MLFASLIGGHSDPHLLPIYIGNHCQAVNKKIKKSFLVPMPTLPLLSMRIQLVHKTLMLVRKRTIVHPLKNPRHEQIAPGTQGRRLSLTSKTTRCQPRCSPNPNNCSLVPIPTLPLVSINIAVGNTTGSHNTGVGRMFDSNPNNYTKRDGFAAVIGDKQPETRRNPRPRHPEARPGIPRTRTNLRKRPRSPPPPPARGVTWENT